MSHSEQYLDAEDLHPIDMVETLATRHEWDFDRIADDRIAMAIEGQWRVYSITLAWAAHDETQRLLRTFEIAPPQDSLPRLYEILNLANDRCWAGAFTYWAAQGLMVYRHGLVLAGAQPVTADQIARMVESAVLAAERYYPAFQLACWGNRRPEDAMQVAIAEGYGRA